MRRIVVVLLLVTALPVFGLDSWPEPNREAWSGLTVERIDELLETVNVNDRDEYGQTPLMHAAAWSSDAIVIKLLKADADVQVRDNFGRTPLMYYALNKPIDEKVFKAFRRKGADINARDNDGISVLMMALLKPAPRTIELFLKSGADVNARSTFGATPLMFSYYQEDHLSISQQLLDAGAEINARTKDGLTPLLIAAHSGLAPGAINLCIESGADVNAQDGNGFTPIMALLLPKLYTDYYESAKDSFELLVSAGGGINKEAWHAKDWEPALLTASRSGHTAIVELLLQEGVSPNVQDSRGWTALMGAAWSNTDILPQLLEAGADVNARSETGNTALTQAVAVRNIRNVQLLIEAGAEVNVQQADGSTLLMSAVWSSEEIVRLLLEAGADTALRNNNGYTALDLAKNSGKEEIIELLEGKR